MKLTQPLFTPPRRRGRNGRASPILRGARTTIGERVPSLTRIAQARSGLWIADVTYEVSDHEAAMAGAKLLQPPPPHPAEDQPQ
jgi:hypothetical protein